MRIKKEYVFRNVAEEYLLIPTGKAALTTPGLMTLSESGCLLYQKLQNECSKSELITTLRSEYDVSEAVAEKDIDAFLEQMRQLDMLVEESL